MKKRFKNICRARKLPENTAMELGVENIPGENRLEVRNENGEAHVYLSGAIGGSYWDDSGITEDEIREALGSISKGTKIHAHINSEGGSVQEGLGIFNALKERRPDLTSHVEGYACSIASVIPLAADKVVSPDSAIWMIHQASSGDYGNADEKEKSVKMLREHDEMLAEVLSEETGQPIQKIRDDMKSETWIRGSQAVEYGLATDCDAEDCSNKIRKLPKALLDRFINIPANIYNSLLAPIAAPTQGTDPQKQKQKNIMNREQILALLKTWGVPTNADMTDDQLSALIAAGKPATPPKAAAPSGDALAQVQAQLANERRARITSEVNRRSENKIKNCQVDFLIEMAMNDEAKAYAFIGDLPTAKIGADPLGPGRVEHGDDAVLAGYGKKPLQVIENIFKEKSDPRARYQAVKDNYETAMVEARRKDGCKPGVFNANSYSATLTTNFLVMGATIQAGPKFAAIRAFSRDVSVDPYKPLATGVMKFTTSVQDGSDVQTNATDFTTGDSTVTAVSISVAQYTASANLTNSDLNSGIRMEDIALPKLRSLGSKIVKVLCTPITTANFSTLGPLVSAPAAFGFSELQNLLGLLKKANSYHLLLDGEYLARLTNVPTFFQVALKDGMDNSYSNVFGWDFVAMNTEWSGGGANLRGFACDPQAIGVIAGLPLIENAGIPGGILSVSTGTIPGANMPIAAYLWFDVTHRTYYMSYDSMFGAAKLDTTIGCMITSA